MHKESYVTVRATPSPLLYNTVKTPSGKVMPESLEGTTFTYVGLDNPYMRAAYDYAQSLYEIKRWNKMTSPASALVKNGAVIAIGNAGDGWHQREGRCNRVDLGLPSGVGYDQCAGCHPDNHSERVALRQAQKDGVDVRGAEVYLYGHWWACASCQQALQDAGVVMNIHLLTDADMLFDRTDAGNVIGSPEQFAQ